MEIAEKIFGRLIKNDEFLQNLKLFIELPETTQQKLFDAYIASPYRRYFCLNSEKLASILDIDENTAHGVFHIFEFLVYNILPKNNPEEIVEAFRSLKFDDKHLTKTKKILIQLKESGTQRKLTILDLIDDEIGKINPHLPRIDYQIDQRLIIENNEIVDVLPVIIFQLRTRHRSENRIAFELTKEDIENLINKFTSIRKQLDKIKSTKILGNKS